MPCICKNHAARMVALWCWFCFPTTQIHEPFIPMLPLAKRVAGTGQPKASEDYTIRFNGTRHDDISSHCECASCEAY